MRWDRLVLWVVRLDRRIRRTDGHSGYKIGIIFFFGNLDLLIYLFYLFPRYIYGSIDAYLYFFILDPCHPVLSVGCKLSASSSVGVFLAKWYLGIKANIKIIDRHAKLGHATKYLFKHAYKQDDEAGKWYWFINEPKISISKHNTACHGICLFSASSGPYYVPTILSCPLSSVPPFLHSLPDPEKLVTPKQDIHHKKKIENFITNETRGTVYAWPKSRIQVKSHTKTRWKQQQRKRHEREWDNETEEQSSSLKLHHRNRQTRLTHAST